MSLWATRRLGGYILARVLLGVAASLAVIWGVVLMIEIVELARTLGARAEVDFLDLAGLALLKAPGVVVQLLAFVFLFGAMAAFVVVNRRGELVALRAAGLSAWAFVGPSAAAAFVVGILVVAVVHPATARMNEAFDRRKAALTEGPARPGPADIWLRQADGAGQIVIHARRYGAQGGVMRLMGVTLFVHDARGARGEGFDRRIEASEARLGAGLWRLTDVRETGPGAEWEHSEQLAIPSNLDRASAIETLVSPGAVSVWRLPGAIRAARIAGYSAAGYEMRLQQLLATPLLLGAMMLLAAIFSLRLTRLGHLPVLAAAGVATGFAVFFVNALCGALGSAEIVPPLVAAWSPPLLTLCFGAAVLCYTEDG